MSCAWQSFIFKLSLLFFVVFPTSLLSTELVGLLPFTDQRSQQKNDWLGYYMQARLEFNLRQSTDWEFHTQSALRLWKYKSQATGPISSQTSILIMGTFQQVLNFGQIDLDVRRFSGGTVQASMHFEESFSNETLGESLDLLAAKLGQWVQPEFQLKTQDVFPDYRSLIAKEVFDYRRVLFLPGGIPEVSLTQKLLDQIDEKWGADPVADLAEGLIIISSELIESERNGVLNEAERVLRMATRKYARSARLHALLAEVYYLKRSDALWVETTAQKAISLDPQSDLAYLMLALVSDATSDAFRDSLMAVRQVNPRVWPDQVGETIRFQKGVLELELFGLMDVQQHPISSGGALNPRVNPFFPST